MKAALRFKTTPAQALTKINLRLYKGATAEITGEIKEDSIGAGDIIMASGYTESLRSVTLGVAEVKYIDID